MNVQDLSPEDKSTQQDLIHLLIFNLYFWGTRGRGTTACTAKAKSQEEEIIEYEVLRDTAVVLCCHLLYIRYSYGLYLIIYLVKHFSSYVRLIGKFAVSTNSPPVTINCLRI